MFLGGAGRFRTTNWASCERCTMTSLSLTAVCMRRTLSTSGCCSIASFGGRDVATPSSAGDGSVAVGDGTGDGDVAKKKRERVRKKWIDFYYKLTEKAFLFKWSEQSVSRSLIHNDEGTGQNEGKVN